jgi:tight adherence protein B
MLYGPNVLFAFIGAMGVLMLVLSIMAIPHYRISKDEEDTSFLGRLQRKLDQADLNITATEYLKTSLFLSGILGLVAFVLTEAPAAAVLGTIIGFFAYWTYLEDRREKWRRAYQEALLEVINILQEGFASMRSLEMAIATVADHAPDIVRADFVEIATQMSLQANLEEVLMRVAKRRRDMIFDRLVEALIANRRTGGQQLGPVLAALRESVQALASGRRRVATAQERIRWEARIVCLAPFTFIVILRQTAPDLQGPFYASIFGQIAIILVGVMSALAYYIMNRIGSRAVQPLESAGVSQ